MERRIFLKSAAGIGAGLLGGAETPQTSAATKRTGRLKQSVVWIVFGKDVKFFGKDVKFEDTCREAARIGIKGYDFVDTKDWPILKKYGLTPSMYPLGAAGNADNGLNQKELHDTFEKSTRTALKECAAYGAPNIIAFAGVEGKVSYEEGAENCVAFFNVVKAQAEDAGVNICLELLSHPGQMFNHTTWGLEIVKRVNSPRVGILYDIYHAQIQDGNIVQTIRDNIQWIKHFHTAGNPGRHQLDDNQELNYRFIARAIAELKYDGWVGHEYFPREGSNAIAGLKQAFEVFDI
jgi:hydroxypyruvate isomerase